MSNGQNKESKPKLIILGLKDTLGAKEDTLREFFSFLGDYNVVFEVPRENFPEDRVIIFYSYYNPGQFFKDLAQTQTLILHSKIICIPYSDNPDLPFKGYIDTNNRTMLPPQDNKDDKKMEELDGIKKFELPPQAIAAIEAIIVPTKEYKEYDIKTVLETVDSDFVELRTNHTIALMTAWAFNLYLSVFKDIAHGDAMDFTNTFLGPIAAGYELNDTHKQDYFNQLLPRLANNIPKESPICKLHGAFDSNQDLPKECGLMFKNMKKHVDTIWNTFDTATSPKRINESIYTNQTCCEAVESLLIQTGRIREWAGFSEQLSTAQSTPLSLPHEKYKILVIDDHAEDYWSAYFDLLSVKLKGKNIEIIYSKDGCDVLEMLPDFDLVFLDVVLGKEKQDGIKILDEIRKSLPTLPVIIASTKHDPNLADQLQRANAFVYKKNIHLEQLVDLVSRLLREGHGRKCQSLPNPFFNDNIIEKREEVMNFTNWAFKHLDGFHGVDNDFFRYFNDHGGRHMTSLMSILERLIRPFLLPSKDILGLKSKKEETVLCLYLAVLCHEFGMFPLRTKNTKKAVTVGHDKQGVPVMIEDYSSSAFKTPLVFKKNPDTSFGMVSLIIRKFHGPRSMFMLLDPALQYPEFQSAFDKICNKLKAKNTDISQLRAMVAALAGYHNRFMSLHKDNFLEKIGGNKDLLEEIVNTSIAELVNINEFNATLKTLNSKIKKTEKERVRKLCAIFRFADALDIDYSRAIPCYLGYNDEGKFPWEEKGYIEDLKRYIVKQVEIDCGKITIHFNMYNSRKRKNASIDQLFNPNASEVLKPLLNPEKFRKISAEDRKRYERTLNDIFMKQLEEYCTQCDPRNSTEEECFLNLKRDIKSLLCGMVMLELYDEYQAIKDVDLDKQIQFGHIAFGKPVVDCSLLECMRDRYRS